MVLVCLGKWKIKIIIWNRQWITYYVTSMDNVWFSVGNKEKTAKSVTASIKG